MATRTQFSYGPHARHTAEKWIPAAGTGRPWILYVSDNGFKGGHPDGFFDVEELFTQAAEGIDFIEGTDDICCFAPWVASHAYQRAPNPADYAGGTTYDEGDVVEDGASPGDYYISLKGSNTGNGVADTEWFRQIYPNNIAMRYVPNGTDIESSMTPGYAHRGVDDVWTLFQHIVDNATYYGVDPTLGVLMGQSSGGMLAALAAFGGPASVQSKASGGSSPHLSTSTQRPAGLILSITLANWNEFTRDTTVLPGLMEHAFGRRFASDAAWADPLVGTEGLPISAKDALSPLRVLQLTQSSLPVYLRYITSRHDDTSEATVWAHGGSVNGYHHALNGHDLLVELVDVQLRTDCVLLEDSATGGFLDKYTTSTSSSALVTDNGATRVNDMKAWLESACGWTLATS